MDKDKTYQFEYTSQAVAKKEMYDSGGRYVKAQKLCSVLTDYLGDLGQLKALEVSCSAGHMSSVFATEFSSVDSIDIDSEALDFAEKGRAHSNLMFHEMDALKLGFESDIFDVVICNQVYEHVADPDLMMTEIYRVLKPGGVCLFGATNRLKVVETHYGRIPFLSWLPKPLANVYLKVLGKGSYYYENLQTLWGLRKLVSQFHMVDYTATIIAEPVKYFAEDAVTPGGSLQKAVLVMLKYAYFVSPGYIWILIKE